MKRNYDDIINLPRHVSDKHPHMSIHDRAAQFAPYAAQYGVKKSRYQYPMDRNFGGIYSPDITIFRESEANGYKLMSHPKEMASKSPCHLPTGQLC